MSSVFKKYLELKFMTLGILQVSGKLGDYGTGSKVAGEL